MRNHSYEIEFHLHVHFHANQTSFHLNGFAQGLVLKMRQRETRKWPVIKSFHLNGQRPASLPRESHAQ